MILVVVVEAQAVVERMGESVRAVVEWAQLVSLVADVIEPVFETVSVEIVSNRAVVVLTLQLAWL